MRLKKIKKKEIFCFIFVLFLFSWPFFPYFESHFNSELNQLEECTSAVVAGWATPDGRPLLWKNRDIDVADNKIVFLTEGPLKVLALVNADSQASVWMGVNEAGLAIINTASEDLEGSSSSQNGSFQKKALLNCRNLEEFEELLRQTNLSGRFTRANYGVIDASGAAAYFETGNHSYTRFNVGSSGFLIRTNFAFTGDGTGTGRFRYDRAFQLISGAIASRQISPDFILRHVARDLVNDIINPYPLPYPYGQDGLPAGFIRTANSINRYKTRSAVVFQGVRPGEDPKMTTMWVMLGEPVCTVALPLWLAAEKVPLELNGLNTAPLCDAALIKKQLCYPLRAKQEYLNTAALDNGQGGGIYAYTFPIEDWVFMKTRKILDSWRQEKPSPSQISQFQSEVASVAYACFLAGSIPNDNLPAPLNLSLRIIDNRSLFMKETVHFLAWQPPISGIQPAGYRIYDVSGGERRLLAELKGSNLSYWRRNIDPTRSYIYAVLAIDNQGREGNPAVVKIPGSTFQVFSWAFFPTNPLIKVAHAID